MRNRVLVALALAGATLGAGATAAVGYSESDPSCRNATTGIDGAGIWIHSVTGNSKCQSMFTDTENPTGPGKPKSCDIYLIVLAYGCV